MSHVTSSLFAPSNLVAWCVAAFDARERNARERMLMLRRLGLNKLAYDWRERHIPYFDDEVTMAKAYGIELTAWWFPSVIDAEAKAILDTVDRHQIFPQIWVTRQEEGSPDQEENLREAMNWLRPIAEATSERGLELGLYNHLGWFGEPENQIELVRRLKSEGFDKVGLVYNLHHGHSHLPRFRELLKQMTPYLIAFNLNGMTARGEELGRKILPIGHGEFDRDLLQELAASGWRGPVGILNHTEEDAEVQLARNLNGLRTLMPRPDTSITE